LALAPFLLLAGAGAAMADDASDRQAFHDALVQAKGGAGTAAEKSAAFYKTSGAFWRAHWLDYTNHPDAYADVMALYREGQAAYPRPYVSPDPERYRKDIELFKEFDAKNALPKDPALFVGSSTIMKWRTAEAFPGFSVINRGCASGNYSYPHELGHNFGARHDTYVDSSTTPYAYGHGWVDVGERWRDVMAYNNACAAVGVSCTRIPYFSNPNQTYGSPADLLGSAGTADTVRVINQNAATVANFRASAGSVSPPATCTYSLSATSASVPATGGSGSDMLSTGSGCSWTASSSASWLTVASATSGTGSASVSYAAGANAGGTRSANLTIAGQTFVVTQAAATVGTPSPAAAAMSASSLAFGTVGVGKTSAAKSVTLTNSGGGTLTISSLAMGGANPGDFARSGTCAVYVMLSVGQSCTLGFTFSPTAIGTRSATLSIGTSAGTVALGLSGSGKTTGHR